MSATRLTSFSIHGRTSFGMVTDAGMVDLGGRLGGRYSSLLALIQAGEQGLKDARAAAAFPFADYPLSEVQFLRPVLAPEKIVCVGINYPERAGEYKDGREKPKYPNLFVRFPDSLVGHGQPLVRPKASDKFDYEGEIVLVIGKTGRNVPREQALSMVYGLTLGNEGTLRDWLRHGTLNVTQGKNFDASGSLGPWIVPADEVDPGAGLHLMTRVNGELRQDDNTMRLTWNFAWLINYITQFATLKPGDLIFTGTPVGAGGHQTPPAWLKPGDVLEVEVPEIGVLRNPVIDET
ncbi:MAG TPA: fumarylacetoacetate hydrolase family protein [Micropepsaceae bacterium]|jgi:2-keto-4-pentenoate hydratase/2-oxohepta-3-ene-1,7-dioic acid hydratase in catechol pathway|nr:fumarylacetoacetate hydrolase family protein [Micropepsaceae bacterium]